MATMLTICGLEVYATLNRARFDFTEEGELDGYITSSLVLSTLFTSALFLFYLIFPGLFSRFFLMERKYFFFMFAHLLTYPAFAMFQVKQRIEYKYRVSAVVAFTLLISTYILALVLTLNMENDRLFGRVIGQYILYIAAGIGFYAYFVFKSRHVSVRAWKYALRIGLPLVFVYLGSQLLLSSDVFVVRYLYSNEEVSYLSVVHSCSHIIILLIRAMNSAWSPWFFDMLKVGSVGVIRKIFRIYLWFVICGTAAIALLGPEIIRILGGKAYRESLSILPVYILCGVFTVLTSQFSNLETYHKKTEYAAIFTGIAAALNVGLNIIGVKLWGYQMVAYATLICQLLLVTLHYLFTKKLGVREILLPRTLMASVLFSLLMIPAAFLLYQNNAVRYTVIGLLIILSGVALWIRREDAIRVIRKIKSAK